MRSAHRGLSPGGRLLWPCHCGGRWPRLAWRGGSPCGPFVDVPHAAMLKARASALGLPAARLAQEVPSAANRGPLPATPLRTGTQVQLEWGGAQTAAHAPDKQCCSSAGPGRLWALRCTSAGSPVPGTTGRAWMGVSWTQSASLRRGKDMRGAGSQPPGQSRVQTPPGLHEPGHVAGPPWAAVSLHRMRQSKGSWAT